MDPTVPSLDPQDLLANEGWMRSIARGVLFDEHAVDDVIQEAWMAALAHPPRQSGALRGWLAVVTRRRAISHVRSKTRRDRREQALSPPEPLPSTADMVEQATLRREVVDAVLALDEPYRSTVMWRYFQDLEPGEIARRSGEPAATVRSRLKRGLDRIRERLDAAHGGDRRRWAMALIPVGALHVGAARTAAAAGAAAVLGGFLMAHAVKIGAGLTAAVLITVAAVSWGGGGADLGTGGRAGAGGDATAAGASGGRRAGTNGAHGVGGGAGHGAPATAAAGTPARAGASAAARPALPSGVLALRVVSGRTGKAIAGAAVTLSAKGVEEREMLSAADGAVTFLGLPKATYTVEVARLGFEAVTRAGVAVGAGIGLGDVALAPLPALRGRVLDPAGAPVANARVDLGARVRLDAGFRRDYYAVAQHLREPWQGRATATTDATGAFGFAWDDVEPGEWSLRVRATGLAAAFGEVTCAFERVADVTLTPGAAATLVGLVVDADDKPVAGCPVRAVPGAFAQVIMAGEPWEIREHAGVTDREGRFTLDDLTAGTYTVAVGGAGHRLAVNLAVRVPGPEVTLRVGAPLTLVGTVSDKGSGRAVEGVAVVCGGAGGFGAARTGSDGRYRLEGLSQGGVTLLVTAPGRGPVIRMVPGSAVGEVTVDLTLESGITIAGRVVRSDDGSPIAGARVLVIVGMQSRPEWGGQPTATTDATGAFAVAGVSPVSEQWRSAVTNGWTSGNPDRPPATIVVHAPGFVQERAVAVELLPGEQPTGIEVRCAPARTLRGRLTGPTGAPVVGAEVRLGTADGQDEVWTIGEGTGKPDAHGVPAWQRNLTARALAAATRSAADGSYALEFRVGPEAIRVWATHPAHVPTVSVPFAAAEAPERLDLVLPRGGTVRVSTVGPDGAPLTGVSLRLTHATHDVEGMRTTETDAQGRIVFEGLPAGRYGITRAQWWIVGENSERFEPVEAQQVEVEAGATLDVTVRYAAAVALAGIVVDTTGAPVTEVLVTVHRAGELHRTDGVGPDGRFEVRLLSGPCTVGVVSAEWEPVDGPLAVTAGGGPVVLHVRKVATAAGR